MYYTCEYNEYRYDRKGKFYTFLRTKEFRTEVDAWNFYQSELYNPATGDIILRECRVMACRFIMGKVYK